MNNRIVTDAEISNAIRWRLSGLTEQEIDEAVACVVGSGGDPDELCRTRPGLGWTTVCAITALAADRIRDVSLFYRAGFEVVIGLRRSMHAACKMDALSEFIAGHLVDVPWIEAMALWRECVRQVEDGDHRTITAYDPVSKTITYRPGRKINYEAFYARFLRLRKRLTRGG